MFARIVLAVASLACSIAAVNFARSKLNRHDSQETLEREEVSSNRKESNMHADTHGEPEEKEDASRISVACPSCRSFQDNDPLLLPEFNDLCQEVIDIPLDSDNPIHGGEDVQESKCISSLSSDSSSIGSQNSDMIVGNHSAFEVLTGENDTESDSDVEIARLKSVIAGMVVKESKLEAELFYCCGIKEQQVELERQLHRKNEEIEKLNDSLFSVRKQRVELLKELEGKEFLRNELELAQVKIKNLQITLQSDASESQEQILFLRQQVSRLQQQVEDAKQKDMETGRTLTDREIELGKLSKACIELEQQNEKLMMKFDEAESKINDLQQQNEKLMTKFQEAEPKINDLLQQNEELMTKFHEAESKIKELSKITESDVMAEIGDGTSIRRQGSRDLSKQLEDLQLCRLNEIEEMLDMRRLNTRLRYELEHTKAILRKAMDVGLVKHLSPTFQENAKQLIRECAGFDLLSSKSTDYNEQDAIDADSSLPSTPSTTHDLDDRSMPSHSDQHHPKSKKTSFMKRLRKWGRNKSSSHSSSSADFRSASNQTSSPVHQSEKLNASFGNVSMRTSSEFESARNSTSDSNDSRSELAPVRTSLKPERVRTVVPSFDIMREFAVEDVDGEENAPLKQGQNTGSATQKGLRKNLPLDLLHQTGVEMPVRTTEENQVWQMISRKGLDYFQTRDPRIPKAIPTTHAQNEGSVDPRIPKAIPTTHAQNEGSVDTISLQALQREPVEWRRAPELDCDGREWFAGVMSVDISHVNQMISEIQHPSEYLLAVKADIEKQGKFVRCLAAEVHNAAFHKIEDVIVFVTWLDEELSFLVDEHAVLKHFDWPENKANALREAALDYLELRKLDTELCLFEDSFSLPPDLSLKRMQLLLEKVERSVRHLLRSRDVLIARYTCFSIPTQWMLDSGLIGKIKLATGKLARKYMNRVMVELDALRTDSWTARGGVLMRQGVGFARRAQQIAGAFDAEGMEVFEQLRRRVYADAGVHVSWT